MKRVPITGTTLTFLLLFLSTFLSTAIAQSLLIQPLEGVELTAEEADRKTTAEALPFAGENALIEIGNLAESFFEAETQVVFPLINCGTLTMKTVSAEYESEEDFTWYGTVVQDLLCGCKNGHLLLMSKEGRRFGHLDIGGETYDIAQLSDERHLMTRSDFSEFEGEECGVPDPSPNGLSNMPRVAQRSNEHCEVKVLALYNGSTVAAEGDVWTVHSRISMAIAQTNTALQNSRVRNTRLVLVGVDSIPGAVDSLPGSLQLFSDVVKEIEEIAKNPTVRSMRDAVGADIVAFVSGDDYTDPDGGDISGYAASLELVDSLAYILVETGHATSGSYTFAHEMGHIFSCRHNRKFSISGYHYGGDNTPGIMHGYRFKDPLCNEKLTVMHIQYKKGSDRILHYSNPGVHYAGQRTGTFQDEYNAEQFRSTACTVAHFRDTLNQPMTVFIDGDAEACPCDAAVQKAAVLGGMPGAYSYEWRISTDGVNYGNVVSTSLFYAANTPCDVGERIFLKLKVTDSAGQSKTAFGWVRATDDHPSGLPCERSWKGKNLSSNDELIVYPNPSNGRLNLDYKVGGRGVFYFFDQFGRLVHTLASESGRANIETSILPSGVYFCHFIGDGGVSETKFIVGEQ